MLDHTPVVELKEDYRPEDRALLDDTNEQTVTELIRNTVATEMHRNDFHPYCVQLQPDGSLTVRIMTSIDEPMADNEIITWTQENISVVTQVTLAKVQRSCASMLDMPQEGSGADTYDARLAYLKNEATKISKMTLPNSSTKRGKNIITLRGISIILQKINLHEPRNAAYWNIFGLEYAPMP